MIKAFAAKIYAALMHKKNQKRNIPQIKDSLSL